MKTVKLLRGDIYFQYKYGFYVLYALFSLIYITILYLLPDSWQHVASALIIFSDPVLIGLVFMGAVVLFEKSERVLNTIAVSPINTHQYIASKVLSIALISLLSGFSVAWVGATITYLPTFIVGVLLGSILFSLTGLIISARASTLNGFIVAIAPVMVLATAPAGFYMAGYTHWTMQLLPSVSILNLIMDIHGLRAISVVVLCIWIIAFYNLTAIATTKMMKKMEEIKL